jgi:hypothetical protein
MCSKLFINTRECLASRTLRLFTTFRYVQDREKLLSVLYSAILIAFDFTVHMRVCFGLLKVIQSKISSF